MKVIIHKYVVPLLWFILAIAGVCLLAGLHLSVLGLDDALANVGLGTADIIVGIVLLSVSGAVGMLLSAKFIIRYFLDARVADDSMGTKVQQLKLIVESQARQAAITCPELAIYDTTDKNAFAVAIGHRRAMLVVSQGLLDCLTLDELSAVVGHEISHISTGDMLTLSLMQGVVNMFVHFPARLLGLVFDSLLFKRRHVAPVYKASRLFLLVTLGGVTSLIVMWFSRQREFRADAGGARLAGHAEMMAALRALQAAGAQTEAAVQPVAVFGLNGRFLASGIWRLFSSHPSLIERIQALSENG